MKTVFIYILKDPITGLVRYIGKTENIERRLRLHYYQAKNQKNHRACWIRSLISRGLEPELQILTEISDGNWQFWERAYIELYRELGFNLVNTADGGEGTSLPGEKNPFFGKKHTQSAIEKNRKAHLGRKHTEETRKKISVGHQGEKSYLFGKFGSQHHCFGTKRSLDVLKKMSASQRLRRQKEKLSKSA